MNTKEYLSKILPTVKDLLSLQGYKQESELLQINNITCEEDYTNRLMMPRRISWSMCGIWKSLQAKAPIRHSIIIVICAISAAL